MLDRINQLRDRLSPAEMAVADWLLAHPDRLGDLRLATLAERAGVSEPTVVRFCRSVGATGFRDMRLRLAGYLATRGEVLHAEVAAEDAPATVADKVIGASIRELRRVQQAVDGDRLDQAAKALARAARIAFVGVGASASVALDAQNKFFRLGLACAAFCDEPSIRQAAAVSAADTAFVAISKTGESSAVVAAVEDAVRAGAATIALTSPGSRLALAAQTPLLIDVDEDTALYTPMSSRLAQLAMLDVLQICTAIRAGSAALDYLDASKAALTRAKG